MRSVRLSLASALLIALWTVRVYADPPVHPTPPVASVQHLAKERSSKPVPAAPGPSDVALPLSRDHWVESPYKRDCRPAGRLAAPQVKPRPVCLVV
jgi:hypothetical protein